MQTCELTVILFYKVSNQVSLIVCDISSIGLQCMSGLEEDSISSSSKFKVKTVVQVLEAIQ